MTDPRPIVASIRIDAGAVGHDAELADAIGTTMERMKARMER